MDRVTVKVGDTDLSLTEDMAERLVLDLVAALYWARHEDNW